MKRTRLLAGLIVTSATLAVAWQSSPPTGGVDTPRSSLEPTPLLSPSSTPAPAATPKDPTVDELIAQLAPLKAQEAKLTVLLRTKLKKQRGELEKLKKVGVDVEGEPFPITR